MQKSTLYSIILFVSSLLTLIGSGVAAYFLLVPEHRDVITVQMEQLVEEETDQTVSFTALSLYPGAECTYTLELMGDTDAVYDLLVSFTDEGSSLTEYLHARLALEGRVLCDEPLSVLLADGWALPLSVTAHGEVLPLTVTYYIPYEIGNEAQGAEASFLLSLRVEHGDLS